MLGAQPRHTGPATVTGRALAGSRPSAASWPAAARPGAAPCLHRPLHSRQTTSSPAHVRAVSFTAHRPPSACCPPLRAAVRCSPALSLHSTPPWPSLRAPLAAPCYVAARRLEAHLSVPPAAIVTMADNPELQAKLRELDHELEDGDITQKGSVGPAVAAHVPHVARRRH